jgi:MoaA/NifB/PqqE/SkfB family radical SAM enzyme
VDGAGGIMKAKIKPRIDFEGRTKLETVIPLSTPYLIFLDPSDVCNAKCKWCPTGSGEAKRYKVPHVMDFELYKKIIDDLCDMPEPIKTLRLYKDGEPLLNENLSLMISYAKSKNRFLSIDTTTNGILLDEFFMVPNLIASGLDKIFISVPRNYTTKYIKTVRKFYNMGRNRCQVYVKIIGDYLNDDDKHQFMSDFGNISDRIFIENLSPCWPGYDAGKVGEKGIYGQALQNVNTCPYIFYSLAINSDGTVSLCFLDWRHDMWLGDLRYESFKDIWNGVLLRNIRMDHLRGHRMKVSSNCDNCGQLRYGAPDDIDQYAFELLRRI